MATCTVLPGTPTVEPTDKVGSADKIPDPANKAGMTDNQNFGPGKFMIEILLHFPNEIKLASRASEQTFHLCQRLVELGCVLAATAGLIRFAAAFAADNRSNLLNDFASRSEERR